MHVLASHLLIGQLVVGDVSELISHFSGVFYTWKQSVSSVFALTLAVRSRSP